MHISKTGRNPLSLLPFLLIVFIFTISCEKKEELSSAPAADSEGGGEVDESQGDIEVDDKELEDGEPTPTVTPANLAPQTEIIAGVLPQLFEPDGASLRLAASLSNLESMATLAAPDSTGNSSYCDGSDPINDKMEVFHDDNDIHDGEERQLFYGFVKSICLFAHPSEHSDEVIKYQIEEIEEHLSGNSSGDDDDDGGGDGDNDDHNLWLAELTWNRSKVEDGFKAYEYINQDTVVYLFHCDNCEGDKSKFSANLIVMKNGSTAGTKEIFLEMIDFTRQSAGSGQSFGTPNDNRHIRMHAIFESDPDSETLSVKKVISRKVWFSFAVSENASAYYGQKIDTDLAAYYGNIDYTSSPQTVTDLSLGTYTAPSDADVLAYSFQPKADGTDTPVVKAQFDSWLAVSDWDSVDFAPCVAAASLADGLSSNPSEGSFCGQ